MKGIILSAGFGKRLRPITDSIPKGLINLWGKPVLEHILLRFKYAEIEEVLLIIGYLGDKIKDYFKDGRSLGIKINYINQENPNGTGSAVLLAKEFIKDTPFMLSWGDIIVEKEDYINIRKFLEKENCDAVLGVNYQEDLSQGGAVFIENKDGKIRIKEIIEKPKEKVDTTWNQSGLFLLKPIIFGYLEKITPSERGEYEFTSAIKLMLQDNLDIRPFFVRNFIEIGNLEQLEKYRLKNF